MGNGQPYLYNPPARYSAIDPYNGFNPKSVTMASNTPPPLPKPKPEGPLLNFNRHPDSYIILPGKQSEPSPMSSGTKSRINWTRRIQLCLRAIQLLGAIGILVCGICIRGSTDTQGLVIRIPPAIDIILSIYGVYHLFRPPYNRPPASSASYHGFAALMDTGFVGFFVITAFLSRYQYLQASGTEGRWGTILKSATATNDVLMATYLGSFVLAGLHLASLGFDIYLCVMFKKIANLPPDMNPLEDGLTARRKAKHKHKNSSVSDLLEKRQSDAPGSRQSQASSKRRSQVRESFLSEGRSRQISFFDSRNDQDVGYSPHNPRTARLSKANWTDEMHQQPGSARQSRTDFPSHPDSLMTPNEYSPNGRRVSALPSSPTMSKRSSAVITAPVMAADDFEDAGTHTSKSSQEDLRNDNWFVIADGNNPDSSSITSYDPYKHSPSIKDHNNIGSRTPKTATPSKPTLYSPHASASPSQISQHPLSMNPPTPPPQPIAPRSPSKPFNYNGASPEKENHPPVSPLVGPTRTQTMTSSISALSSSTYSRSTSTSTLATPPSSANAFHHAPKGRFFGDLNSALRGVRRVEREDGPRSVVGSIHGEEGHGERPWRSGRGWETGRRWEGGTVVRKDVVGVGRVVSRSGVEVGGEGTGRRREVSGKVAEEGRGWGPAYLIRRFSGGNNNKNQ